MTTSVRSSTRERLDELLSRRILVLDGAMGALIYGRGPEEEDYRGSRFRSHPVPLKNCTEAMVLSQPRLIEDIHRAYLEAGADIISTATFNGTRISLAEFQLQEHVAELNRTAAALARRVADDFSRRNPDRPRFVAGSIGPTNKSLSLGVGDDPGQRDVTFDQMAAVYAEQVQGVPPRRVPDLPG
jgi:5-methyltetrahydrofolate--homocysteine methyltransferase